MSKRVKVYAVIHDGDDILVRKKDGCLPGGWVKKHESLIDAAKRETLEEAGLKIHGPHHSQTLDCEEAVVVLIWFHKVGKHNDAFEFKRKKHIGLRKGKCVNTTTSSLGNTLDASIAGML